MTFSSNTKLSDIIEFKARIKVLTGLHIGSGNNEMHIGGTDSPVIKHPHSNKPYIPGSSLKGKMRSLLELAHGVVTAKGGPMNSKSIENIKNGNGPLLLQLFGTSGDEGKNELGPTRLIFRDATLNEQWLKTNITDKNLILTETKFENSINRISGTAENPRNIERVPAGTEFDFCLAVKCFETDNQAAIKNMIFIGLKLIEKDALGGSGSRGYGRIQFIFEDEALNSSYHSINPFDELKKLGVV